MSINTDNAKAGKTPKAAKGTLATVKPTDTLEALKTDLEAKGDLLALEARQVVREALECSRGKVANAIQEELDLFSSDMGFLAQEVLEAFYPSTDKALPESHIDIQATEVPT